MDIPTEISKKQLLRDSCHYFINQVFSFRTDGIHGEIIDHLLKPENNLTLISRGHGKSKMAQGVICWWICNNPDERILLVSDTDRKSTMFLSTIKQIIETSPVIREFYGDLKGETWTDHAITIKGRSQIFTEPTLMSIGAGSGAATGLHASKIIIDDLVSFDSARSQLQRDRTRDWVRTTLMPVLISSGKFCVLGTRYHSQDIYDTFINSLHYNTLLLPAIDPNSGKALCEWLVPLKDRLDKDGNIIQIGLETIKENLGSIIWELQYMNSIDLLNKNNIIQYDYIQYYSDIKWIDNELYVINNGKNIKIEKIINGVDPAISEKDTADFTAMSIVGKGTDKNLYVLDTINKHLSFSKQVSEIQRIAAKWQINGTVIEQVGYQEALIQELHRVSGCKVMAIKPTRDKTSRLMAVSGFFENKKVHFLKSQNEIINQLLSFNGDNKGHDDLVDSIVYALMKIRVSGSGMVVLRM